jgi:hypothetical protein
MGGNKASDKWKERAWLIRLSVDGDEPVLLVCEFGRGALVIDNLAANDDFVTFGDLIATFGPWFVVEIIASIDGEHGSGGTVVGDVVVARAVLLTIEVLDARNLSFDKDVDR